MKFNCSIRINSFEKVLKVFFLKDRERERSKKKGISIKLVEIKISFFIECSLTTKSLLVNDIKKTNFLEGMNFL